LNTSDTEYKILKILERNPQLTQRQVADELGVSLGKTHYVIRALIDKGLLKLGNFRKSNNKIGYIYLLTPQGIIQKSDLAQSFLLRKQQEYEKLKTEIEELMKESGL